MVGQFRIEDAQDLLGGVLGAADAGQQILGRGQTHLLGRRPQRLVGDLAAHMLEADAHQFAPQAHEAVAVLLA